MGNGDEIMPYIINGAAASLAPFRQEWEDVVLSQSMGGSDILYPQKSIRLTFDSCPLFLYSQWESVITNASGGSINLWAIGRDSNNFRSFSGVYIEFDKRPDIESGIAQGPWSVRISEVSANYLLLQGEAHDYFLLEDNSYLVLE